MHLAPYLQNADLVHVQERRAAVNTADRSDRAARMCAVDLDTGIESSGPALIKMGLSTPDEINALRMAAREEFPRMNVRWDFCATFGQRPFAATPPRRSYR